MASVSPTRQGDNFYWLENNCFLSHFILRSPREGEVNGVAYNFVTKVDMEAAIDNDEFIEHATFAGNMYGTSKAAVKTVMDKGNFQTFLIKLWNFNYYRLYCNIINV